LCVCLCVCVYVCVCVCVCRKDPRQNSSCIRIQVRYSRELDGLSGPRSPLTPTQAHAHTGPGRQHQEGAGEGTNSLLHLRTQILTSPLYADLLQKFSKVLYI
jgi:hypothetical protein